MKKRAIEYDVTGVQSTTEVFDKVTAALLALDPRRAGSDYVCPTHDDNRPSLGVTLKDGHVLLHCSAGCTTKEVLRAIGMTLGDLASENDDSTPTTRRADPLPSEESIRRWSVALRSDRYWTHRRGIDREVLERYQVGWNAEAKSIDGSKRTGAYMFPYRDAAGKLLNVKRRWQAKGEHSKTFRLNPGYPTDFVWPPDQLNGKWVVLVEGEPDALRLISLGIPAVTGINGVKGATKSARVYAPTLKNMKVVVAFDSSPVGRSAAKEVARTLSTYAKEVRVFDPFPGRTDDSDMSDWLTFHGDDVSRFKREVRALAPVDRIEGRDIPDRTDLFPDGKFNGPTLGQYAEEVGQLKLGPGKSLWRYLEGRYIPDGKEWLGGYVREALREEFREGRLREVEAWCKNNYEATIPLMPPSNFINCTNGILYWREKRIEAPSPEVPSIIQIGAAWDPKMKCPTIDSFFASAIPEDCISFLWEWIGYLLIPTAKYQRALMVHGPGDTGKSTLLRLLGTFLGHEATCHHSLQDLCDDKFAKAGLYGKLANIHADLDARSIQSSGVMKTIISGDRINAQHKYGQPFDFEPVARHIYSANDLPGTSDQTDAYYKRWFILPMYNKIDIKEQDPHLESKMRTSGELSGMLNRAVAGLERLEDRQRFLVPKTMRVALQGYKEHTDTVAGWVKERLVKEPGRNVRAGEAFNDYVMWCAENGRRSLGKQRFREHLLSSIHWVGEGVRAGYPVFTGVRIDLE